MTRHAARPVAAFLAFAALAATLAGCDRSSDPRPSAKPDELGVAVVQNGKGGKQLTRGRVSTKSGDILILEADGTVSEVALDSPSGRDAFDVSQEELEALSVNLGLDLSAAPVVAGFATGGHRGGDASPGPVKGPTAQEKALEAFAARTQPAFPKLPDGFKANPENFIAVNVKTLGSDKRGSLVEVSADLQPGVDADVAMAYATCALAGWAQGEGRDFARHVRTLQDKRGGKLMVGSVFTTSSKKPMGLRVMETNATLRECKDRGIPVA